MRPARSNHRFALFHCPVCRTDFALAEHRLACTHGHSFDLAKSGYVNLAVARKRAPAAGGDTRQQLEHRARFLGSGHFDFIADMIADQAQGAEAILDAGCGTGFHLMRMAERLAPDIGAGIDLSKEAAAWCARRYPWLGFVVADIWDRWPVHDRSVDLITSIFAPKNHGETARVLRPGGMLALVHPGAQHLQELRRSFGLLGVGAGKVETYLTRMARDFDHAVRRRTVRRITLERDDIVDAGLMGPSARHLPDFPPPCVPDRMDVTIDVAFLFARRRR